MPASAQQVKANAALSLGGMWESNPLHLPPRGGARSDWRLTPGITFDLSRDAARYRLFVKGDGGYELHRRYTSLNSVRGGASAGGYLRFGAFCRVEGEARVEIFRVDPGDVAGDPNRLRTLDYRLGARCPRDVGLYPAVSGRMIDQTNGGDLRSALDSRVRQVDLALNYARPSLGLLSAYIAYGRIDRPNGGGLFGPSFDVYRTGIRFERAVSPRLEGSTTLGYADLRTHPGYSGLEWRGDLTWRPKPGSTVGVSLQREARVEGSIAARYTIATRAALDIGVQLGARSRLALAASRELRDFRGARAFDGELPRDRDRTIRASAKLEYRLTPDLLLDGQVTYARRDAGPALRDYRSTGAGLRMRYQF